jgi:GGDEF domain-containing protein
VIFPDAIPLAGQQPALGTREIGERVVRIQGQRAIARRDGLVERADLALYRAKADGRDCVRVAGT